MILMSSFHLTSAMTTSFSVLFMMRFLHGAISSATDPVSYSLIADYFPPEKRSTANAILSTGNFIGIALSSLSIILIKQAGWRRAYGLMGLLGLAAGFMGLVGVREPKSLTAINEAKKITNKTRMGP